MLDGGSTMRAATTMTREFRFSANLLRELEDELRQKLEVAKEKLRETEIELSQVKAALVGLGVERRKSDTTQLNRDKELDDLFGVLQAANSTSNGAQP